MAMTTAKEVFVRLLSDVRHGAEHSKKLPALCRAMWQSDVSGTRWSARVAPGFGPHKSNSLPKRAGNAMR